MFVNEPYYVQTDKRTERFATGEAAQVFIELHCKPHARHGSAGPERLIRTNAYS